MQQAICRRNLFFSQTEASCFVRNSQSRTLFQKFSCFWKKQFRHIHMFQRQQLDLTRQTAGVTGQTAVCSHNSVTRNQNGNGIVSHSTAHRLRQSACTVRVTGELRCDLPVCHSVSIRNCQENLPDTFPKRCGFHGERRQNRRILSAEIAVQPRRCLPEYGQRFRLVLGRER